jgi:hypothetical protein
MAYRNEKGRPIGPPLQAAVSMEEGRRSGLEALKPLYQTSRVVVAQQDHREQCLDHAPTPSRESN